ncbi:hypothetical protein, partial [uncultured Duncaniella sp.]|uniref:hypothetical protein n=1 Tax=uncultured Duncaniella sp. TaxID=2768039 RepID=UPI002631AEBC
TEVQKTQKINFRRMVKKFGAVYFSVELSKSRRQPASRGSLFFRGIVKNQAQSLDRRYRKNGMSVTP